MVIIDFQEAEWPKKVEIFTRLINHIIRAWFYEENILHNFLTSLVLTDITTVVYCWTRNWYNIFQPSTFSHINSFPLLCPSFTIIFAKSNLLSLESKVLIIEMLVRFWQQRIRDLCLKPYFCEPEIKVRVLFSLA